ncbi:hypothetical protein H0H93_010413 [Arthromyces matolae]|nr:hypothetical protein H0H93_010413 [Arthromyces matolae]
MRAPQYLECLGSVTPTLTLAYMYASNALNSDKDKAHFDYTPIIGNVVGILLNPPEKCLQCKDQFLTIVRESDIWGKFQSLGSRMCGVAPQMTSHAATCVNIFVNAFNSVAARRPFGRTLSSASLHSDSEMATGPHVENTIAMHHRHPYQAEADMGLGQQDNAPPRTRQRAATGPSSAVTRW